MVRDIVHDMFFLAQKSEPAAAGDRKIAEDLLDTLRANSERCVGMAANMIGERKRIIAVANGKDYLLMFNPVIIAKEQPFKTEEGCLSLTGTRTATRYEQITVEFQDVKLRRRRESFSGFTAQIIQHECDHLEGILI